MNRHQKMAWMTVISISVALVLSLVVVGILVSYVGMPRAWAGLGFMGLAGLAGLAPLLFRKDQAAVAWDERDQLYQRRAALAGFGAAYMVFGAACMIPFFVLGPSAMIRVTWLPMIFGGAGLSHYLVYSLAILSQYGWRTGDANG
jgi:hypothetical protein